MSSRREFITLLGRVAASAIAGFQLTQLAFVALVKGGFCQPPMLTNIEAGNRGHRDRGSRGSTSSSSFRKGFLSFSRRPILLAGDERADTGSGLRAILSTLEELIPGCDNQHGGQSLRR